MRRTLALSFVAALALSVLSAGTLGPVAPSAPADVSGVSLSPTTGPGLVLSGSGCTVLGDLLVNAVAGQGGVHIEPTATLCIIRDVRVFGGLNGFDVDSIGNQFWTCRSNSPTGKAFDSDTGTSGSLHVHGQWEPRTEAGFVESQ